MDIAHTSTHTDSAERPPMSAQEPSTDSTLPEVVAGIGSALLKTLPSRRWVHDRHAAAWGDMESFVSTDAGLFNPRTIDFAEMNA